ncbi:hypothetical protein G5714_015449 [Onychostoma macrolepis]|uniref:holo-[acyl-carrier-protein] synthase n=1 Tax=Onychostoma macrolepis TaxID=369639 RepID=A0A7J6CF85_9TELE|nr:hypothetical protein G5714_015449 [Onychostoma macrolepis]
MDGVRWAFRCGSWVPTRSEWTLAARCVQQEEKDRIAQFVFAKDAKSAMAGRLLIRKLVCEKMGFAWDGFRLERTARGKPFLPRTSSTRRHPLELQRVPSGRLCRAGSRTGTPGGRRRDEDQQTRQ